MSRIHCLVLLIFLGMTRDESPRMCGTRLSLSLSLRLLLVFLLGGWTLYTMVAHWAVLSAMPVCAQYTELHRCLRHHLAGYIIRDLGPKLNATRREAQLALACLIRFSYYPAELYDTLNRWEVSYLSPMEILEHLAYEVKEGFWREDLLAKWQKEAEERSSAPILGTPNQIIVTNGAGSITLSVPQNLAPQAPRIK